MIRHRQRLSEALGFIITTARPDRVHVAPIFLRLRMNQRIAINLGRRSRQETRAFLCIARFPAPIMRAERSHLQRLNRQFQNNQSGSPVTRNAKRNSPAYREKIKLRHILLDELEIRIAAPDARCCPPTRSRKLSMPMTLCPRATSKSVEMRAEKAGRTSDDGGWVVFVSCWAVKSFKFFFNGF